MAVSARELFFSKVTFRLEVGPLNPDQAVFVVGDGDLLGNWEAKRALKLSRKPIPHKIGAQSSIWELSLELVTGVPLNYKYLIIGRDRRVKWESVKTEFRTVTPTGFEMLVLDGAFGSETDEVWVDEGWLNSDVQVRFELGYCDPLDGTYTPPVTGPLVECQNDEPDGAISQSGSDSSSTPHPPISIHFFDGNSLLSREVIHLPMKDRWTEVVFHMNDLNKLKITVEAYDRRLVDPSMRFTGESQTANDMDRLARTSITKSMLKDMRGFCSVPLFNTQLEFVGTLNFKYLVVTPFVHPLNNLASIWKSFTRASKPIGKAVGHRGCGTTRTTFISENTILSFLTAADYGADYVEFDVQLTNEGVPVIYHDFHIPLTTSDEEGLLIPLSSLTKKQFKSLRPSSSTDYASPINAIFSKLPRLKRSKSTTCLPKSHRKRPYEPKQDKDSNTNQLGTRPNGDDMSSSTDTLESSTEASTESPTHRVMSLDSLHAPMSISSSSTAAEGGSMHFRVGIDSSSIDEMSEPPRSARVKSIINPHDQFATLDETLRLVPAEVGFVIEIKYPAERFQHASKMRYAERNLYADAVLKSVFNAMQNPLLASRKIMLISFDPDLCVLLSQKQPRFPVLFLLCLNHGIPIGEGDDEIEGYDPRCQSLETAAKFARDVRLQGLICDAKSVLEAPEYFVSTTHDASLLLMTYGTENMEEDKRAIQKNAGVDSLIMDNVVHINRESRNRKQVSNMFLADYGRQNYKLANPNIN